MHIYRLLMAVSLLPISTILSAQTNWHVATTGSDATGDGTIGNPFATVKAAAEVYAQPGDTVQVRGGTYRNTNYGDGDYWKSEKTVRINNIHGTSSAYIVIKSYQDESVLFQGDGIFIFQLRNSSYVRVEGFEIEGEVNNIALSLAEDYQFAYKDSNGTLQYRVPPGTPASEVDTMTFEVLTNHSLPNYFNTKGLLVQNSHHIDIIDNVIHHMPGTGLRFNGVDYVNVIGNEVHNSSRRSSVGTHGFVFDSCESIDDNEGTKIIIARNNVHHNYNEVYSWNSGKTFIVAHIDEGKGISMQRNDVAHGWLKGRISIENNIAHHNGFSGIHSNQGARIDFVNNTVYYNSFTGTGNNIGISAASSDDITIKNNISVAETSFGGAAISASNTTNLIVSNNLVLGTIDSDIDSVDVNTIFADPAFVDSSSNDFRLLSTSLAINQALISAAPTNDYDDITRDSLPDIGAYEYVAPQNTVPVITSAAIASGTEDQLFVYTATATDAEGDTLTYIFSNLSSWLTAAGDSVTGTPTEGETSGSFRVIVSDGSLKDTLDVTITVAAVNDPPIVAGIPSITLDEDSTFSIDLDSFVSDSDNDTTEILWTVEILHPGGSAPSEKKSSTISESRYTTALGKTIVGESIINKLSFGKEFEFNLSRNSNKTKLKGSIKNKGDGGRSVIYVVSDGGSAADSIMITIDSVTHVAKIKPNADYFAFNIPVVFIATDPDSLMSSDTINITVTPVNDAPMFVDFPDSVILEFGESDTLILSEFAFDIDDPDSRLTFAEFSCEGADTIICVTTNADTAFINPDGIFSGMAEFEFFVTDTSGASDTASVIIYVKMAVGIVNEGLIPMEYSLSNNYPNPFNPQTTISYGLPQQSNLSLIIYNLMGEEIMRWDEQNSKAGFYQKIWSGRNKFEVPVSSGVYFYRIIAGDFVQTRKMVLLK